MTMRKGKTGLFVVSILIVQLYLLNYIVAPWLWSLFGDLYKVKEYYEKFSFIIIALSYCVMSVSIWTERKDLDLFHFDRVSLIVISLSGFLLFFSGIGTSTSWEYILILITGLSSLLILVSLCKGWFQIPSTSWKWVAIGILAISLALIPTTIINYILEPNKTSVEFDLVNVLFRTVLANLYYSVPVEEPIFRGLLWGYLHKLGWKENRIIVIQAVLFWLMHTNSMSSPLTFFISLPLVTIIYSLLVKYSKQLFPSIVSHILYNTLVSVVWRLFLRVFA